jgi:hypothetical protein
LLGFWVTFGAALAALGIWLALRRKFWRPWLGFASSTLDVSLVTFALVTFVFVGSPLVALNSKVTFEIYYLAIIATSLRYDERICIGVGVLAVAQYAGLWAFAALRYDLNDPTYAQGLGEYSYIDQTTRLILLTAAVMLAYAIVRRAQRLLHLAARDRLTGVYNRGQFDLALEFEVERAQSVDTRCPSQCSTWITSRASTTPSVTRPAIACWWKWRRGSRAACGRPT